MSTGSPQPEVQRVTEPKQPDRSLGELFGDLGAQLSALLRNEVELAKTETRQEVRRVGQAASSFAAAAVAALLTLTFLSSALAWLLDQWINRAVAFLTVAVIWAIVATVAFGAARRRAERVEPMPETIETMKENIEWAKQQKS